MKNSLYIPLFTSIILFGYKKSFLEQRPFVNSTQSSTSCLVNGIDTCMQKTSKLIVNLNEENQTIEHFGASDCWSTKFIGTWGNQQKKNQIADYLFSLDTLANGQPKGIGLSIWRFNLGAGSFEQGQQSGINDEWRREECFLKQDGTYDWTKQSGQQWFLNAAKARGLNNFLAFSISPPVQYTINGKAYGLGTPQLNLKSEYKNDFADFMVKVVDHFQSQGYNMSYLSPFNEPQWDWGKNNKAQEGTGATNSEISDMVKILGPKIKSAGLSTQIALGEAAQWNFLNSLNTDGRGNQLSEFFTPASANYVGSTPQLASIFSAHSYYTTCPVDALIKFRKDAFMAKNQIAPNLRLWQTEFGILGDICGQINGGPKNTGIDYGLYVAKVIHHDLSIANVTAWHWWLAISPYNYSDALVYVNDASNSFNLESTKSDGIVSDSKQLWCLGNYSRFIRPGMVRVYASLSSVTQESVAAYSQMVSAYKDKVNKKVVIVIVNMESSEKNYLLEGVIPANSSTVLTAYTTNASSNLAMSKLKANKINIPAKSVVTLVGDY